MTTRNLATAIICLSLALAFRVSAAAAEPVAADNVATPSAHNPCFDQKGLWPADVKKTAYYKQKWEPARLLVWARKGDHMGALKNPANWLENGKPAEEGPDENTDVLFPDVDGKATLTGGPGGWETWGSLKMRHLTIGRGVRLCLRDIRPYGNVWVRKGASWNIIEAYWRGNRDTFARNDSNRMNMKIPSVSKLDNASVETLGPWENDDGIYIYFGKLIIGPDSSWWAGDRHQNTVASRGTLILMSGATFQVWTNKTRFLDLDIYGELLAGTPERPLERDAFFPLSFKSRGRLKFQGKLYGDDRDVGLVLRPKARMAVYSSDPSRARLVFRQWRGTGSKKGELLGSTEQRVQMVLLGKTELNGVLFNDIDLGGIEMTDLSARGEWKNIHYGENNAGESDALFKKHAGVLHREEQRGPNGTDVPAGPGVTPLP